MDFTTNNAKPGLDLPEASAASGRAELLVHSFGKLSINVPTSAFEDEEEQILWPRSAVTGTPSPRANPNTIPESELYDPHGIHGQAELELIRGDYGSKVYTPRTRGARGHRSTKSESAVGLSASPALSRLAPSSATPAAIIHGSAATRWDYAISQGPGKGGARTPRGGEKGTADLKERDKGKDGKKKKWSEEMENVDAETLIISAQPSKVAVMPVRPRSTPGEIVTAPRPVAHPPEAEKSNSANSNDEKRRGRSKKGTKAAKPVRGPGIGADGNGVATNATSEPPVQNQDQKARAPPQKNKPKAKGAGRSKSSRSRSPASPSTDSSTPASVQVPAAAPAVDGKRKRSGSSAKRTGQATGKDGKDQKEKEAQPQGKLRLKARPSRLERKIGKQEKEVDEEAVVVPSPAPSTPRGLGQRSVVDDLSEYGDLSPLPLEMAKVDKDRLLTTAYDEAVKFMNSCVPPHSSHIH